MKYVMNKDELSGHFLESKFMSEPYGGKGTYTKLNEHGPMEEVDINNKDDFRDWFFFSSGYSIFESISGTSTTVTYIAGSNAASKDRKSTRLNSSHVANSYAVFCLK